MNKQPLVKIGVKTIKSTGIGLSELDVKKLDTIQAEERIQSRSELIRRFIDRAWIRRGKNEIKD